MMKFVLTQEDLNVQTFAQFMNESQETEQSVQTIDNSQTDFTDSPQNKKQDQPVALSSNFAIGPNDSTLDRTNSEFMLRGYSSTSKLPSDIAGMVKGHKGFGTVYPCYRVNRNGIDDFVFYDADMERAFELFKPVGKNDWMIKIGEKNPSPDRNNPNQVRTAAELKTNFDQIYKLWESKVIAHNKIGPDGKKIGGHTISNIVKELPIIWDILVYTVGRIRRADLLTNPKTLLYITDEKGTPAKVGSSYSNVKQDPLTTVGFSRGLTTSAHKDWYSKNVGDLPGSKSFIIRNVKSADVGKSKVADMIRSMGLNTEEGTAEYTNTELMQIFNNIIQNNPYAPERMKSAWQNILNSLYSTYYLMKTENVAGIRYEFTGPELYNKEVAGKFNSPETSNEIRVKLFSMLNNYILGEEGLSAPDANKKNNRMKDSAYKRAISYETTPIKNKFMESSLYVPRFDQFLVESLRTETYLVRFLKPVDKNKIDAIKGVVDAMPLELKYNTWEITGNANDYIRTEIYRFALDNDNEIIVCELKDKEIEQSDLSPIAEYSRIYAQKKRERDSKIIASTFGRKINRPLTGQERLAIIGSKENAVKRLKLGVYGINKNTQETGINEIKEIIFDAGNYLSGYVVIKLNQESANKYKYSGKLVIDPAQTSKYITPEMRNTYILKSDGGYISFGIPSGSHGKQMPAYYESQKAYNSMSGSIGKDIYNFETQEEAYDAVKQVLDDTGIKCVPITVDEAVKIEFTQEYNVVKKRYNEYYDKRQIFYLDPEMAEKKLKTEPFAKSTEMMKGNVEIYESFVNALYSAFNTLNLHRQTMMTVAKMRPEKIKKSVSQHDYSSVAKFAPEVATEIKSLGHAPETAKTTTLLEYLLKSASLIKSMKSKLSNENYNQLVLDWDHIATTTLETFGFERQSVETSGISDELLNQIETDLSDDELLKKEQKVSYVTAKAYLQMFIREIGSSLIDYAMSTKKEESIEGTVESEMKNYMKEDYILKTELADIWRAYMQLVDSAEGEDQTFKMPHETVVDLRTSLLDKAETILSMESDDDDTALFQNVNGEAQLPDEQRTAIYDELKKVGASPEKIAKYKKQLYSIMRKVYDEYIAQKTQEAR